MANLKSSKKDLRRSSKRREKNQSAKSALKTHIKKVRVAILAADPAVTATTLATAVSSLDKAVQLGVIHKNQAARRKSRIAKAAAKPKA